jgi:hypothetical protein
VRTGAHNQPTNIKPHASGLPLREPLALSHVHGDHIATLCWWWIHLCHLEQQLPAEGAHSPRVRGEGLVLGVLRMRQGAVVTGGRAGARGGGVRAEVGGEVRNWWYAGWVTVACRVGGAGAW